MSIDPQTGRYCLPCSIDLRWRMADIAGALDGLPPEEATKGQPITDLLCGYHRYWFLHIPIPGIAHDRDGRPLRWNDGTATMVDRGALPRAQEGMEEHLTQGDILTMLERMEKLLRYLDAVRRRERSEEVIVEQPTTVLPSVQELLANSRMHAQIYDFLTPQRLKIPGMRPIPQVIHNTLIDDIDPDDRSGGEE